MALLLDFSPIKSGGGAQLALNFLKFLSERDEWKDMVILISDRFPFKDKIDYCHFLISPSHVVQRLYFENVTLRKYLAEHNIDKIYTFFGPGLPRVRGISQIVSVAYPIICYDESPYWRNIPWIDWASKKVINFCRKRRLKNADKLIFETEIMRNRCIRALGINMPSTFVLPPSPTKFLKNVEHQATNSGRGLGMTNFLILSGVDFHKNILSFIRAIALTSPHEREKIVLFLSVNKVDFINKYKKQLTSTLTAIIDEVVVFVGPIKPEEIQNIYDKVDVVVNLSDLESFSNNYMEAWLSSKPILASDRDFSRYICGDSAIYVEPHDINSVFWGIMEFVRQSVDEKKMIKAGKENLLRLPSLDKRIAVLREII